MGEVEDVEVVQVGKDLPLDHAQLIPRKPVTICASQSQMRSSHISKTGLLEYFLRFTKFQSPEPVELGQSGEVGVVQLDDQVVAQVERLQAEKH